MKYLNLIQLKLNAMRRSKGNLIAFLIGLTALGFNANLSAQNQGADYSAGMSAYMNSDFESARNHWLAAAQQNDARAMFNLGLLHERQRIAGANEASANEWFAKAGNAGYAPADYHLALRLQTMNQADDGERLMRRAADAGFILAQERLGQVSQAAGKEMPTPRSTAQPMVSQDKPAQERDQSQSASIRLYQRENWIMSQAADAWTIQMLAFSDEAKVRNFIDDHALHRKAAYFAEGRGDAVIYKLIYGAYESKQAADSARSGFTSVLKEHGPWLRPIKGIQSLINEG